MDRALKTILISLLVFVAAPVCAFFAYDRLVFQPRLPAVHALLAQADPEDREPPPLIQDLIEAMHTGASSPSVPVARSLLFKVHPHPTSGPLGWHPRFALWQALVSLHLSEAEIIGLYSSLAYNGTDHGLNKLSLRTFHKPLSALSAKEAATVVATAWGPGYYARHPDKLAARRDKLLAAVQHGP